MNLLLTGVEHYCTDGDEAAVWIIAQPIWLRGITNSPKRCTDLKSVEFTLISLILRDFTDFKRFSEISWDFTSKAVYVGSYIAS